LISDKGDKYPQFVNNISEFLWEERGEESLIDGGSTFRRIVVLTLRSERVMLLKKAKHWLTWSVESLLSKVSEVDMEYEAIEIYDLVPWAILMCNLTILCWETDD